MKTCSVYNEHVDLYVEGCCKIDQLRRSLSVEMRVMSVSVFCLSMLRQVWPDRVLDWLSEILCERHV